MSFFNAPRLRAPRVLPPMSSREEVSPGSTRPLARSDAPDTSGVAVPERAIERPNASLAPQAATPPVSSSINARQTLSSPLKRSGARWRLTARVLGAACFILGAALLMWTFLEASRGLQAFSRPDYLSRKFNTVGGDNAAASISAGIIVVGAEVLRVLYLLLMGAFASFLAARGANFFAASDAVMDEAMDS